MKWFSINTQKITIRLTMRYTLFIFITLIIMSVTTLGSVKLYTNNQSYNHVEDIAHIIKHKLEINESFSADDLNDISQINENIDINIVKNGNIIFKTQDSDDFKISIIPMGKAKTIKYDDDHIIYFNKELISENNENFIIQVIKDMEDEGDFIELLFWILLILNAVAFLVSIILGFIMSKRALNPIEKIVEQARAISGSDLSKRISIEGPNDELKHLAETFNEMIASIEKRYEIQNRFALDASHEIATPLAVINGYIDIIRRWGKGDPEIFSEAIDSIKKEIKNMTNLLDKLLFVAKTDNEISQIEKNKFWLNELIAEVIKESKLIHTNFDIILNSNETLYIYADKRLIKQMLRAILDNSIKYSKEGTKIVIDSKRVKDKFKIEVSDQGIGISTEDLSHIFNRFYRVDKARTRELGGSGLGLSIVKWIAEAHGGSVDAESTLGEGTKVIITLPIGIN